MDEQRIIEAAIEWWRNKRPVEFDETKHLENPDINCVNAAEKLLARAVVDFVRGYCS